MFVERHKEFVRQMEKLDSSVRRKAHERFQLLAKEPSHPLLHDHKLHHPWAGYSSINVTGDYRLVYKKLGPDTYFLRAIGTHHQLFGT